TYGTYHLPEAQMDRFIMKISIGYPGKEAEMDILLRNEKNISAKQLEHVITCQEIVELMEEVKEVHCSDAIRNYIVEIVEATREEDFIKLGVIPRGSIALYRMAKAYAFVKGRSYVVPDDIKDLAPYVLSHRIILTPKGKSLVSDNEEAIRKLLQNVIVPIE
ncbi:MAG: MoxR family ATPase, partial [Lachnospiraceae bacterium]|nr:MoxR family ATPase [Lachnospiraceae bacterium]